MRKAIVINPLTYKSGNNDINPVWEKDGHDFILHLGTMRKAVVVVAYYNKSTLALSSKPIYYSISPRSYFPFKNEAYIIEFNNADDCKKYAISLLKEWIISILVFPDVEKNK